MMQFNFNTIKSAARQAASEVRSAVRSSIKNSEKFSENYKEIVTPAMIISGTNMVLPVIFPSLATAKYFRQVRAGIIASNVIAAGFATATTHLEVKHGF